MDNSAAKDTLEKSWVHNNCIKPSEYVYLQIKVKKYMIQSAKMSHIALCIVKYIHEKNKQIHLHINIYYKIEIHVF